MRSIAPLSRFTPIVQRGAVLVVVLVLLTVLTLLGLIGTRVALQQERMGANLYDRSLAFNIAEQALREGEGRLRAGTVTVQTAVGCTNGLCGFPNTSAAPVWEQASVWDNALDAADVAADEELPVERGKYIIEYLANQVPSEECPSAIDVTAPPCPGTGNIYRITSLVQQPDGARVMLQSIFVN